MTGRVLPTIPTILRLAWPIVVTRSTQVVVGLADALMVAHLGESSLAATTTGALNSFTLFILPMGMVFIVSTFASQYFGKGDLAGARRFGWYGLVIAAVTELVSLAALPFIGSALGLFDFEPSVSDLLEDYLVLRIVSGGAVVGIEALAAYYGGLGKTKIAMRVSVATMIIDLVGNWLLIDGHLGFPALGVQGAALSSTVSTFCGFAYFLITFLRDGMRTGAGRLGLRMEEFRRTLRYGVPTGINYFFEFFAFVAYLNVVIAGLGTTALAAFMAVIQLNSASFMPAFAVASAGAIVSGQAIGAGAPDDVPKSVRLTLLITAIWQGFVGVLYVVMPGVLFSPFVRENATPELMIIGTRLLMLSAAWQLFDAAANTFAESLRAAGDTSFTLWARLAIAWLVFVPGSFLSAKLAGGGDVSAMLWLVTYLALLAIVLFLRFRSGAWRRFNLLKPSGEAALPGA